MRSMLMAAAVAAPLLAAGLSAGAEPFKNYDRFADRTLDPAHWQEGERIRLVKAGQMNLMQRTWGTTDSDFGLLPVNWQTDFQDPAAITQLRARATVTGMEVSACPTNPSIADARARIMGSFFNIATPTPGSAVNDVIAQARIYRASNSADPAGVLRVQGIVSVCTTADCAGASTIGNIVDLGTVTLGTPVTLELQWDQAAKTFRFARDGGASSGSVGYAFADAMPPGVLYRLMGSRVNVPSCLSAPRVSALVDVLFDNVSVNASAAP